jgi:quinol monooxygenase YgiN
MRLAALALAFLLGAAAVHAADHPIIELAKAKLKDQNKPFTLIVILTAKEDKIADFEAAFVPAIRETRKEKGCLNYELNRDPSNANAYMMYERWKTLPDLDAHLKTKHITELIGKLGDLTSKPPEFRILLPASEP